MALRPCILPAYLSVSMHSEPVLSRINLHPRWILISSNLFNLKLCTEVGCLLNHFQPKKKMAYS